MKCLEHFRISYREVDKAIPLMAKVAVEIINF